MIFVTHHKLLTLGSTCFPSHGKWSMDERRAVFPQQELPFPDLQPNFLAIVQVVCTSLPEKQETCKRSPQEPE